MNDDRAEAPCGLKRLMRAYWTRRYAVLFYALLATIAAGPILNALQIDSRAIELLLVVSLLSAVASIPHGAMRRTLLVAIAAAGIMRLAAIGRGSAAMSTTSLALWALIALIAAVGAVRVAIRARSVDREHLYAALDAYLLLGIFLGVLYWALERTAPGSLAVGGAPTTADLSLPTAIYFSFVTLVTLGYGDIVPLSDAARGLAVAEAVTGQLYLTVMIAHLVTLHVRERPSE